MITGVWIPEVSSPLSLSLSLFPSPSPSSPRGLPARAPGAPALPLATPGGSPLLGGRAPAALACPQRAQRALARTTVVVRRSTLSLIYFNFSLVDVLRRALRRAAIHSKFIFINELCRTLRRAMFRFKFSSVDVCRRAFRRATLNVFL